MRRFGTQVILTILAAVLSVGCAAEVVSDREVTCSDMTVGERKLILSRLADADPALNLAFNWSLSGPGRLVRLADHADSPRTIWHLEGARRYHATDPGMVVVTTETVEANFYTVLGVAVGRRWVHIERCRFEVTAGGHASEPPAEGYTVTATVTESNVEEVAPIGLELTTTWQLSFPCDDGRCDGQVVDGGPFGDTDFPITYRPDSSDYAFDAPRDLPANPGCGEERWSGQITPTTWGDQGPDVFDFFMATTQMCDIGDIVVEWEGTGTPG